MTHARALFGLVALSCLVAQVSLAHEARPAYLEITETAANRYEVLWRTPVYSGARLPVRLRFPEGVHKVLEPTQRELADSLLERHVIDGGARGLAGQRIEFVGLQ